SSNKLTQIRNVVVSTLEGKSDVYKHMVISHFVNEGIVPSARDVIAFTDELPVFSDNFFQTKLNKISTLMTDIYTQIDGAKPDLGINRSFLEGNFSPKTDKIFVNLLANGAHQRSHLDTI